MKASILWSLAGTGPKNLYFALTVRLLEGVLGAINPIIAVVALHQTMLGVAPRQTLMWVIPLIVIVFFLRIWLLNFASIRLHRLAVSGGRALRLRLLDHLVSLPLLRFRSLSSGKIAQLMSQDMTWTENYAAHGFPTLLSDMVAVFVLLIGCTVFFPSVGLVAISTLTMGMILVLKFNARVQTTLAGHNHAVSDANRVVLEFAEGLEVIRSSSDPSLAEQDFNHSVQVLRNSFDHSTAKLTPLVAVLEALCLFTLALGLLVGIAALHNGLGTAAQLISASILLLTMMVPFRAALLSVGPMILSQLGMRAVADILQLAPLPDGEMPMPNTITDIRFDNVTAMHGDKAAVQNISFSAPNGNLTALVGPSGAGKTTLFNLMLRFMEPSGGKVTVNGTNIEAFKVKDYMGRFAVVFQESSVFNDTVQQNIRIGRPDASDDDIIKAAKAAQIHDRILQFPEGYQTRLGSNGSILSGGERQRLTIARAFLKDADIVLLDEVTSSLDPENEGLIQQAFTALAQERSVFVIAHRLSTIRHADQILLLENGRLQACGSHEYLMESAPLYQKLVLCYEERTE